MKKFLASTILYVLGLCVGSIAVLLILSAVGYVPYGDRPGPGWYRPHLPGLEEIEFSLGWAVSMAAHFWPWLVGAFLFLFAHLLRYFHSPRWLLRLLSALLSYVVTVFILLIFGWYIALSDVASLLILILALLFGAMVLPRFAPQRSTTPDAKPRWLGISLVTLLFFAIALYPFLPKRDLQSLNVSVFQIIEDGGLSDKDWSLTPDEVQFLKSQGIRNLDQLVTANLNHGPNTPEAEVIVVLKEKNARPIKLNQPKQTRILYLQSDEGWESYPPGIPTIDKKIVITPDQSVEFK